MKLFQRITPQWVIHIFALLHALTTLCCLAYGVNDELLLTTLTIAMMLIICLKKNMSIEFTASVIIVGNIIGFLMGTLCAKLLSTALDSPYAVHSIATLITTEILGWSIVVATKLLGNSKDTTVQKSVSTPYITWLLLAAGGIFIARIGVVFLLSKVTVDSAIVYEITKVVLSNSFGLILLVCINILYIRYSGTQLDKAPRIVRFGVLILFMTLSGLLETALVRFGTSYPFILSFIISLIVQITVYCIIFIINYALISRNEMNRQRVRAHTAEYRYMKMKGQVNPHFLFNSLNILDCLVNEGKNEQASTYIHKLSGIYRYMIKSEEEGLVPLSSELVFVGLYIDLLKVRFPEGFEVEKEIDDRALSRLVLPCSLQMLIENAIKHNVVSAENPLIIKIVANQDSVSVSNNIIPKITKSPSTGLGHKYISRQYQDLHDRSIAIDTGDDIYRITLPLL